MSHQNLALWSSLMNKIVGKINLRRPAGGAMLLNRIPMWTYGGGGGPSHVARLPTWACFDYDVVFGRNPIVGTQAYRFWHRGTTKSCVSCFFQAFLGWETCQIPKWTYRSTKKVEFSYYVPFKICNMEVLSEGTIPFSQLRTKGDQGSHFLKQCVGFILKVYIRPKAGNGVRRRKFRFIKPCSRTPERNVPFINHSPPGNVRTWICLQIRPPHAHFQP